MPLPELDPSRSAQDLFDDIAAYVDEANALVEARDTVSLAGLDTAVEALCARIMALDVMAAKDYADKLEGLMHDIDGLQNNMLALQNELATTLNSLGAQKKANRAYSNAPSGKVDE
jgi:hypothetical protein